MMPEIPILELLSNGSSLLVLLAAGLMVFRTFREGYLLSWLLGWTAFLVYRLSGHAFNEHWTTTSLGQSAFLIAVTLFGVSVLQLVRDFRWIRATAIAGGFGVLFAAVQPLAWSESFVAAALLRVLYVGINVTSVLHLVRFSRARREPALWLMAPMLLLLHLDTPGDAHSFEALDLTAELLLAASMLLVVVTEAHQRTSRLEAINAITTSGVHADDAAPVIARTLSEITRLYAASAAWLQVSDDSGVRIVDSVGVDTELLGRRNANPVVRELQARALVEGSPLVLRRDESRDGATIAAMTADGFDHIVFTPVRGSSSMIGILGLACRFRRDYRSDELAFLLTAAKQLGIAVENVRMFEKVISSQRRWMATFDAIPDPVLVHDAEFRIVRANRALMLRLGHGASEVLDASCAAVLPGSGWSGCPYCVADPEKSADRPDPCFGGFSIVSTSGYRDGEQSRTIHIIRDTTERQRAEQRYRTLFERISQGVFVASADGRILDCNDAFLRLLGYTRDEVAALNMARDIYVAAPQRASIFERDDARIRNAEFWVRRKDGSRLCVLENSFAHRDTEGNLLAQGFLQDITEMKRAEEEVRRRNRELHSLNAVANGAAHSFDLTRVFNVALDELERLFCSDRAAIYLADTTTGRLHRQAQRGHDDADGRFDEIDIPAEFLARLRHSRIEILTQQYLAHMPPQIATFVRESGLRSWVWNVMWSGDAIVGAIGLGSRAAHDYTRSDEELLTAIGRQLATTVEKTRLYEEARRAYEDLRRTQEQLLQSEKMSAVGQLISGVAHELNNPLTAILGYSQLLEAEDLNDRSRDYVAKLYKQTQRTHRVVQNLLSFARQRKPQRQQIDLRRVLDETVTLRDYDLKLNNVQVVRDYAPSLPMVHADPHQLEQVFLNIINNAADAILERSRRGTINVRVFEEDGCAVCEFHDTGGGIRDPKRIFDPFYTTKAVGKGTGLGLSICYGIVKEHGGDITASNHDEGGAVFRIALPATEVVARGSVVLPTASEGPVQGRVLVVDDEPALLEFECEVLRAAGAEVVGSPSGDDAVEQLRSGSFDAVVSDYKMPGDVGGRELYAWVCEHRPRLRETFLFTISNVTEAATRDFLEREKVACIAKPFEVQDLLARVRRLLQSKPKAMAAKA